ncbi:MAG: hypothetical protein KatS3mg121_1282 [Gammaproteobacteria bacterium]|nr:MAG: hypothetical protein KatS3mg121_1282 [Gammaproteobacteria bacterium]
MAAWRRKGGLETFEPLLIEGMRSRGYSPEFAQAIYRQILGFGEYGFPESHSASFALLVYVSAWLKRHEPAAFCCALLNSQPMGFYAPSQLVQDARRHGVEVRPVDVTASQWACTGWKGRGCAWACAWCAACAAPTPSAWWRGRGTAVPNVAELARRCALEPAALEALAAAGALRSLAGDRHRAHWAVAAVPPRSQATLPLSWNEAVPLLRRPTPAETVAADYAHLGVSLAAHPLALLRPRLDARRVRRAAELAALRDGALVRVAGLVTHRQRPGSAGGVVFATLEDETGLINLVVAPPTFAAQRSVFLESRILLVHGVLQRRDGVVHINAGRIECGDALFHDLHARARDFR